MIIHYYVNIAVNENNKGKLVEKKIDSCGSSDHYLQTLGLGRSLIVVFS